VASLPSAPLSDVVAEVLRQSNNDGAELLTKELGRQGGGGPTTAGGVAAIRAALQADGLPVDQLTMVDGSGLDRSDRVTCQLLVGALQHGGPTGPLGAGLPIAGQTGTLQFRMLHSAATGRLHAKTGSLEGVSSLSGFVLPAPADAGAPAPGASGQSTPLTFSLIFNGNPTRPAAEAVEDHIGALLAGFPQAPPVAQLSPLPPVGG
jgi:D-alanyl-D-alanine carboxypeptidase/D-alanyl-D-alanine-endopeptidase (penicillin-binding protein 4)